MSETITPLPLVNTEEAGKMLKLTPRAMEERRRRGDGPPYIRLGATTVRYSVPALQEWIAKLTYSSTAEEAASPPDATAS